MGETLFGKPYGLTPDEQLKAHQILTAGTAIRKTPYLIDLWTKGRKPDVVPKVGDKVKIKSREWYEKWKDSEGHVRFGTTDCIFAKGMEDLCGRELTVRNILDFGAFDGKRWILSMEGWLFVPEMFEEVYPAQEQASAARPKTPYQLDLEVKDRKPSITPKVGDKVKIKSREWYEKWKDGIDFVNVPESFTPPMTEFCGKVLTVEEFQFGRFKMKEDDYKWSFSPEMFEEVYPVQEQLSSKFPKIDLNSPYLYQSPYDVKGSELVLSEEEQERLKEQFFPLCPERGKVLLKKQQFSASRVEDVTKRLSAYTLAQGLGAKPKLKQIKTTHFIKLKKL